LIGGVVTSSTVAGDLAAKVAATVDAAAGDRVIVLGSLPPAGRDLDVLARSPDRNRIESALGAAGLLRKGSDFALFQACFAYGVELVAAEGFVPAGALQDLLAQALPLPGFRALARPAPAHALLILARLVVEEGSLLPKRQRRLERILTEDPHAWRRAGEAAPSWHAGRALASLKRAAATGAPIPFSERLLARGARPPARPRRALLVALSGIDGAGKSSQARWLAESLTALGAEVDVVWNNLLGNRALDYLAATPKALLRLAGRPSEPMARYEDAVPAIAPAASSVVHRGWSTVVTFANAVEQQVMAWRSFGRGRAIVFDRSPLDLAVRMHVLYRSNAEAQRRLIQLAAPRPDLAFLLDIPAEVSLARKSDIWSAAQLAEQTQLYSTLAPRFGVRRIDGQRPPDEIAAEIAGAAWLALR
jgi:thymidylate kinase